MAEKLKPCLFCGSKAKLNQAYDGHYCVSCMICGIRTLFSDKKSIPIKLWNRRADNAKCEKCYHYHMCDLQYRIEENQECKHFKDKSLIVELPCKVGDTVYIKGEAVTVDFIHIGETISCCVTFDCYERDCSTCPFYEDDVSWEGEHDCRTQGYYEFTADDIGKAVFLSREEAENKLKESETNG